jgi:hypothetical protein
MIQIKHRLFKNSGYFSTYDLGIYKEHFLRDADLNCLYVEKLITDTAKDRIKKIQKWIKYEKMIRKLERRA